MFKRTFAIAALTLALVGCDSDNDTVATPEPDPAPVPPAETFSIQVLHASSDAPAVNVEFNDATFAEGADYKVGSARVEVEVGTYPVQVDALLPDAETQAITPTPVLGPLEETFAADTIYTVVAVGDTTAGAENPLEAVILTQERTPVSAGNARVFVLHGASVAGEVDVYVTDPDADITTIEPTATFDYKGTIGPVELPVGDYIISVTAPDGDDALYVSNTISLAEGNDFFLSAVNNVGPGESPISIVALTGEGSAEFADKDNTAALRVTHASPDAGPVDVLVNDGELLGDRVFTSVSDFVEVAPDTYNVKVTVANNASVVAIDEDPELVGGLVHEVIAVGFLADESIKALVETDDPRPLGTNAKVRIIHASPTAQDVDIYVTAPNTDITNVEPLLANIPFEANTGFLSLNAGEYEVSVTPTGTKTVAIGPVALDLENGDVITAIARDADGGGLPDPANGVIVLGGF